jgi:hypothetical protein
VKSTPDNIYNLEVKEKYESFQFKTFIKFTSIIFEKVLNYSCEINDGMNTRKATIYDDFFSKKISTDEVNFSKNDLFEVIIERKQYLLTDYSLITKDIIVKVLSQTKQENKINFEDKGENND